MSNRKRKVQVAIALAGFAFLPAIVMAQSAADPAVMVCATVGTNPSSITLNWQASTYGTSNIIYRKLANVPRWGSPVATLPITATQYLDSTVSAGTNYEYRIDRTGGSVPGYGYLCAGIDLPRVDGRGKIVLLVDNSFSIALTNELAQLIQDLSGDGWTVLRHDVSRSDTPPNIKAIIRSDYLADPANVKALFIFGHIPVACSGDIYPDGHTGHQSAWPADVYYGDMDGSWTDTGTFGTRNLPGDGKFDQSYLPSSLELQVGRVDLWNLPAFPQSEQELLRQYLNKDHRYRHKLMPTQSKSFIDDNFGYFSGEAFAANGWRNFPPLLGQPYSATVVSGDWLVQPATPYLWAYGCGPGSSASAVGVVSTADMTTHDPAVFTMLFGSFFGDWGYDNDLMRAELATPSNGLTCVWGGRPNWFVHPMAMGATMGECARLTQNNAGYDNGTDIAYQPSGYGPRMIHIALMGDPTLRLQVVAPPTNVTATTTATGVIISWSPSPDDVLGYVVYRASTAAGPFTRILDCDGAATGLAYDTDPPAGPCIYMVRAIARSRSGSGTYFNNSQGLCASAPGGTPPPLPSGLQASDGAFADRVRVSWSPSSQATLGYEVWRCSSNNPAGAVSLGTSAAAWFDDLTARENETNVYWVTARNGAGASAMSASDPGFPGVSFAAPPMGVSASDGTFTNLIRVTWQALPRQDATYEVWRAEIPDPAAAQMLAGSLGTTQYDDLTATSLTPVYYYWVRTVKAGSSSALASVDTGFLRLLPPGGLTATAGAFPDRVRLVWSPSSGATSYEVWASRDNNPANRSRLAEVSGTSYDDVSAYPGWPMSYWVTAKNSLGASGLGPPASGFTGLAAPASVWVGSGVSTDAVIVSWAAVSGASSYEVWRNTSNDLAGAACATTPSVTRVLDTQAVPGVTYYYWIRALCSIATGPFSTAGSGTLATSVPFALPVPPDTVTASDGLYADHIAISWPPSSNAASYEIWYGSNNNSGLSRWGADTSGTNYDFPLSDTNTMTFWIRARNAAGLGAFGTNDSGFISLPGSVSASDGAWTGGVHVSWSALDSFPTSGYEIWRSSQTNLATSSRVAQLGKVLTWDDTSALAGTVYYYWLRGTNSNGASGFSAGDSGYRAVAGPPLNVSASDGTFASQIVITWSASPNADTYEIWRSAPDHPSAQWLAGVADTNYTDTTTTPGVIYGYLVRAIGGSVTSGFSLVDTGFAARFPTPPSAVAAGDGAALDRIDVSWIPTDSLAAGYEVWRGTNADPQAALRVAQTGAVTNFADLTATVGLGYYYFIKACSAGGTSACSRADLGWRALSAPATLSAGDGTSSNAVLLIWSAISGASTYEIWRSRLSDGSNAGLIAETQSNSYADTSAVATVTWYYRVRARTSMATGAFSPVDGGWRLNSTVPDAPLSVQADDGGYTNCIHVSWAMSLFASGYEVWSGPSSNSASATKLGDTATTSYADWVPDDALRYYWIKAVSLAGTSGFSSGDSGYCSLFPPDSLGVQVSSPHSLMVQWADRSLSETGYEIQVGIDGLAMTPLTVVASNTTGYLHADLVTGIH